MNVVFARSMAKTEDRSRLSVHETTWNNRQRGDAVAGLLVVFWVGPYYPGNNLRQIPWWIECLSVVGVRH